MTTAYNLLNALERGEEAGRGSLVDPGSGGTIRIFPFDLSRIMLTTAGTRTLQDPTTLSTRNSILVTSSVAAVVISASSVSYTLNAGEWAIFVVTRDSSNLRRWSVQASGAALSSTASVELPVTFWRADAAIQTLLAVASTSSTLWQILNNTYGTTEPDLQVKAAGTGAVNIAARHQIALPVNYRAGSDISIIASVTRTTAAGSAGTANVLGFAAYRLAAPSVNLIATSPVDINAAASVTVTQTITGTNLNPGDLIDIRGLVTTDGGAATAGEWHISNVKLTYAKA